MVEQNITHCLFAAALTLSEVVNIEGQRGIGRSFLCMLNGSDIVYANFIVTLMVYSHRCALTEFLTLN